MINLLYFRAKTTGALNRSDECKQTSNPAKCATTPSPETPLVISPADTSSCWHRWYGSGCQSRSRCIYQNDCCCHFWWSLRFRWPEQQTKQKQNTCQDNEIVFRDNDLLIKTKEEFKILGNMLWLRLMLSSITRVVTLNRSVSWKKNN